MMAVMAASLYRRIGRWIVDDLLWDTSGAPREGVWRGVWAARKLLLAVALAALLTWREWVKHHPPEIAIVAVIHLVFVLIAISLVVLMWQWLRPRGPSVPGK